jgi:hypothetical protein
MGRLAKFREGPLSLSPAAETIDNPAIEIIETQLGAIREIADQTRGEARRLEAGLDERTEWDLLPSVSPSSVPAASGRSTGSRLIESGLERVVAHRIADGDPIFGEPPLSAEPLCFAMLGMRRDAAAISCDSNSTTATPSPSVDAYWRYDTNPGIVAASSAIRASVPSISFSIPGLSRERKTTTTMRASFQSPPCRSPPWLMGDRSCPVAAQDHRWRGLGVAI